MRDDDANKMLILFFADGYDGYESFDVEIACRLRQEQARNDLPVPEPMDFQRQRQ